MRKLLNLRLFDEEAAVETPSVGAEAPVGDAANTEAGTETPAKMSIKDLIKSPEYKEDFDKYIQGIISRRFGKYKDQEATLQKHGEILSVVRAKYGITDEKDLDGLLAKVKGDDSYYEEKAMEEGLTVEQYKRFAEAEARNRQYEQAAEMQRRETEAQERVAAWQQEAEALKGKYPEFDLKEQLSNDRFSELLRMGYPMENAYFAIEGAKMLQGAMERTASAVRQAAANDIQANGNRPKEAASSGRASASVGTDVSKLTRADREELSRRAMSGEIINLS